MHKLKKYKQTSFIAHDSTYNKEAADYELNPVD